LKKKKNACIYEPAFRVEEKILLDQLNSKGSFFILHWRENLETPASSPAPWPSG
jgi:hypothetical protein